MTVAALSRGYFGWNPCRLADEYTPAELARAALEIHNDPANANPEHAAGRSIYLLSKTARKRADAVAWAIYHQQVAKDKT